MNSVLTTFYSDGFFGYGPKGDFRSFSLAHILPIIMTCLIIILIRKHKDFFKKWKYEELFRVSLVAVMLLAEMSYFWRLVYVGSSERANQNLLNYLPLQVCQWTLLISSFMMLIKSRRLFGMTFYLCLTGNVVAMILANTVIYNTGPKYYRYYQFWLEHALPVVGNFYMLYVYDFDLTIKEIWKPVLALLLLSIPCIYLDVKVDVCNFMYLKQDFIHGIVDCDASARDIVIRFVLYVGIMVLLMLIAIGVYNFIRRSVSRFFQHPF